MKICIVVPYIPSLIRVRSYHLVRGLAHRGHEVKLFTLFTNARELEDLAPLSAAGVQVNAFPMVKSKSLLNCIEVLPGQVPLQAVYSFQPELAECLRTSAVGSGPADIVHIEHLRGAKYGLEFLNGRTPQLPGKSPALVWDAVDNISHLFSQASNHSSSLASRLLTRFELPRTRRFENWLFHQFDQVLVTSPSDREAFLATQSDSLEAPREKIHVLPNGVDLDYFHLDAVHEREPRTLVISGKMSYHANVSMVLQFVSKTLPLIWEKRPGVRLVVVGKDPPPALRRLAQDPRITVTGTVADIRPYLWNSAVSIAPLVYGAGIQNKVLEAMACGIPVITTPQAASALQAIPGDDLLVAGDYPSLAHHVLTLLEAPDRQRQFGLAGRRYVERFHRWDHIIGGLEEIYGKAIWSRQHHARTTAH